MYHNKVRPSNLKVFPSNPVHISSVHKIQILPHLCGADILCEEIASRPSTRFHSSILARQSSTATFAVRNRICNTVYGHEYHFPSCRELNTLHVHCCTGPWGTHIFQMGSLRQSLTRESRQRQSMWSQLSQGFATCRG